MLTDEFPAYPGQGRVVALQARVGLGDTRPDGRVRFDALARYFQDVADEDAASAPIVDEANVWVLRRMTFDLVHTPRFRDTLTLATWCSGTGARWAERRTDASRAGDVVVRGVGLWAHVDRESGKPTRLVPAFDRVWGPSAQGRQVTARLQHDSPVPDVERERWPLRATDIDVVGHVNNAAYWAPIEELLSRRPTLRVARAEIEFHAGVLPGEDVDLAVDDRDDGFICWYVVGAEVRASVSVHSRA
jgi:acyl-ACP thioesterase